MRRPLIIAAAASAVLAIGATAGPALAAGRPSLTDDSCPMISSFWSGNGQQPEGGRGMGNGMGNGHGMGRWGDSSADPLAGLAQGTLTSEQKSALAGMAEEEKLAHDVYVALAKTNGDMRFTRIAASEARHVTEVRALLARYGTADPTAGKADGAFASANRQQQYTQLVARGDGSLVAALGVGRDVETADIADLAKARTGVTAPDVLTVYTRMSDASARHLHAFGASA